MGTSSNRPTEAFLTNTHKLCFRAKIRKIMHTPVNPSFTIQKMGCKGVFVTRTGYHDEVSSLKFQHFFMCTKCVTSKITMYTSNQVGFLQIRPITKEYSIT